MPTILPFDIIVQIIDAVGTEDTNLLKKLALVSNCFHQICSEHLFATVELRRDANHKKRFVKLLKSRPDIARYIRKLTVHILKDDDMLSPFFRTISRINCLKINASYVEWNGINPSLASAFIHLMHLPTINHIDLSYIRNFPISILTPSVNLLRLDLYIIDPLEAETVVQSEMMPKIREFHIEESSLMTTKLLHAKLQDGQPAFNFMDLRRLSTCLEDKQNVLYLTQNAKLLEELHLTVGWGESLLGLRDILSPCTRTLKVLDLTVPIFFEEPLKGVCEELEALAGNNILEALSFEIEVCADYDGIVDTIGSMIQNLEKVLVKPGWSALRRVSFKVLCRVIETQYSAGLSKIQSLPDRYLSHLPKLKSITFSFSSYVV